MRRVPREAARGAAITAILVFELIALEAEEIQVLPGALHDLPDRAPAIIGEKHPGGDEHEAVGADRTQYVWQKRKCVGRFIDHQQTAGDAAQRLTSRNR